MKVRYGSILRRSAVLLLVCFTLSAGLVERPRRLFTIERNCNSNVVVYEANINARGHLNAERPVDACWVLYEDHGRREKLSMIEWRLAYGFDLSAVKAGLHYRMSLKSFKKRPINILMERNLPRAVVEISGRRGYLSRIYVHTIKGVVAARVQHIEIFGRDVSNGKKLYEKILNRDL